MKFWVSSAFLFYSPPTFSNPISKIEINQNFFLCKSYSKTSKKILNSWTWTGLKPRIYRAAKHFWGASIRENFHCIFICILGEKDQRHKRWGKTSPQCCLTFLDNPFFVFQNLYPCYRCILNELQKLYGFYGRQGSEAKCTILAYFFLRSSQFMFYLKLAG